MRLRAHATSIALIVAAGGAFAYAYVDRGSVTQAEKTARASSVFPAWRRDELTRIAIEHDGERIVLERTRDDAGDPEWWMRAPRAEKADAEAVDKLASVLELASVVRKVDPGAPPAATKLDAPRARGEVAMGGLAYRFALGGAAPTPEGAAYLRVDDGGAVVVSHDVAAALLQKSDAYRSRRVVPYLSIELARIEVKTDAGTVALTRKDDVSFALASGLRASRVRIDTLWSALAETRAESFPDAASAEAQVATPRVTVTMTPKDTARPAGVLRVGGVCPGNDADVVVVRDAPDTIAACAPKGIVDGLSVSDAALVDTRLFAAHDDEIAELRVESLSERKAIELARKESAWREKAPQERDLSGEEAEAASAFVAAVAGSEGVAPEKSDAPFVAASRVTVHRADNDVTEVVDVSAPDAAGDVIARRAFDGARLHVAAAVARKLAPSGVALRGRELWSPRIEGARVSEVETRCGGVVQRATHEGDAWTLRTPSGFGVDNASVLDLIDAVTRARAESWVADEPSGRLGLERDGDDACTLGLVLASDAGTRAVKILFGGEGEGGVYARTNEDPAVFVAPKGLRDRARAWLVDLHGLAPAGVTSVTLEQGGRRRTFAPDGGEDPVVRAADVLRADGVIHLGPAVASDALSPPAMTLVLNGPAGTKRITLGRPLTTPGPAAVAARVDGVDATFRLDRDRVKPFFDAP